MCHVGSCMGSWDRKRGIARKSEIQIKSTASFQSGSEAWVLALVSVPWQWEMLACGGACDRDADPGPEQLSWESDGLSKG